tara:strand:- start:357 stop:1067 length:711 start_codon:yes stop_codon:yes gene_type:complete
VNSFEISKKAARLIVLQRIEIANPLLKYLRKILGRYIFTNIITKFFLSTQKVGKKYFKIMSDEFLTIKDQIKNENNKFFLSIGGGVGGLEAVINSNLNNKNFYFIERNFISKKIKYGWGGSLNSEAYNDVFEQKNFLLNNEMKSSQINIFDYDNNKLPKLKFDIIISLLSLDYHYDFNIYEEYLREVSTQKTKIIFDTIRADYFNDIFKNVHILNTQVDTVHKSKRILCSDFKDKL